MCTNCSYCGYTIYGKIVEKLYCSKACADKGRRYSGLYYDVLKRDNFTCTKCGTTERLQVHHIDEKIFHNEMSNLVTLCERCHKSHHHSGSRNSRYKHVTKEQIEKAIEATSTLDEAAELVGLTRSALRKKRMEYGMDKMSHARLGKANKQYIDVKLNEIEMAYQLEGTWEKAAERLGLSAPFIRKRYKELRGDKPTVAVSNYKDVTEEDILKAYEEGGNWKEAATILNITKKTMLAKRKKFGLM